MLWLLFVQAVGERVRVLVALGVSGGGLKGVDGGGEEP